MRIAYVITRSDVMGGASVHLLDLAEGVQSRGHEVTIFVGGDGIVVERARKRGLKCVPLDHMLREISPIKDALGFFELRKKLSTFAPDLVHLHSAKAGMLGRMASRSLGLPVIYTAHGWPFTEGVSSRRRKVYALIERLMARYTSKIITVSDYDRKLALEEAVACPDVIRTVHNGIPDVRPERVERAENASPVRLVMVARFEAPKDHATLLLALSEIADLNWQLELIGDGPTLDASIELAERLGIKDKIEFSGARHDVPDRLAMADALILISQWEGFPLTILEAMRASLPVVASDVGGVGESVCDQKSGYLVPRENLQALISSLREVVTFEERRRDLGDAGRSRYEQEFTFDLMLDSTLALYSEVVQVSV